MAFQTKWTSFLDGTRNRAFLLILGGILFWVHAAWFVLQKKGGFLDDAYIYLHLANNVLETGSARFFPEAESLALLASSPLRLLILIPAVLLSRLLEDPRSVESARLTFLFSGPLTGLLFFPFFRRRIQMWGLGFLASGVLSVCTESALQMEGLLLFWLLLILARYPGNTWKKRPGQLGILLGMLFLTRPEYGLPAMVFWTVWALKTWDERQIHAGGGRLLAVVVGWIMVAVTLRVYPIPTTYLSKVITGQLELFGPSFGARLPVEMGDFFLGGNNLSPLLVWTIPGLTLLAMAWGAVRHRLIGLLLLWVCIVFWKAGGNYLWYFENLFIGLIALISGWLLSVGNEPAPMPGRRLAAGWLAVVLVLVVAVNWDKNQRLSNWSLRSDSSMALGYRNIGHAYQGRGLFDFPGTEPCYLVMREIGMASYFGGSGVWLFDAGGLAQPGTLTGAREHLLARLYPGALLVSASEELEAIHMRFGRSYAWPPIWQAYAMRDEVTGPETCAIYLPEKFICLKSVKIR